MRIDHYYVELLTILIDNPLTTYQFLADKLKVSTKTVGQYLDDLQTIMKGIDIDLKLTIQASKGVSLIGDLDKLAGLVGKLKTLEFDEKSDRFIFIMTSFLNANHPIKIQDLADRMHVSRTTAENAIKDIKLYLEKNDIELTSSNRGLRLDVSEQKKRQVMSDIIRNFWIGIVASQDEDNDFLSLDIMLGNQTEQMIDFNIINKVKNILNQFINHSKVNLTEYEYQSLIVHLAIAIERIQKDYYITSSMETGITNILDNTDKLVSMLEESFSIEIPEYETQFINIHMQAIESKLDEAPTNESIEYLEYGKEITNILKHTIEDLFPDDMLIKNLTFHLNTAIKRLKLDVSIRNPYLKEIRTQFQRAYNQSIDIAYELERHFNIRVNEDEIAYISIHLQSFYERQVETKHKIILVCASGYGTAKLLEQRLIQRFGEIIQIDRTVGIIELKELNINDELIISTIPIENISVPVIYVSPLLNDRDVQAIGKHLAIDITQDSQNEFVQLLDESLVFISEGKQDSYRSVLQTMTTQLIFKGYADVGILESAYAREKLSSTAMDNFAMPHGETKFIKKSGICIYVNPNGIQWGKNKVYIVFFMAITPKDIKNIDMVYKYFNLIIEDINFTNQLIHRKNAKQIIQDINTLQV